MDFVTILELVAAIITSFGGIELIKVLLHKREDKKKLSAEAEVVEAEAAKAAEEANDAKYSGVIAGYENLLNQNSTHIAYYKNLVKEEIDMITNLQAEQNARISELQAIIEEKNNTITDLMTQINDLTSNNTALTFSRCDKFSCQDRVPPFGYGGIDIKNGMLITSKEIQ